MTTTTPEPKTWGNSRVSATDLNREVRDQIRDLQNRVNALSGGGGGTLFPTAAIVAWTGGSVPSGWLLCDGRTVLKADYLSLWNEIGIAYNPSGLDLGLSFTLPKLNDALPRGAAGSVNGLIDARGIGGGANDVSLSHPANSGVLASNTDTSGQSVRHGHDTPTIHAGSAHTDNHTHNINLSGTAHNHAMGHNHNLGVDAVAVNRNTGTTIVAVGHNHSVVSVNVDTDSDGSHSHNSNQSNTNSVGSPTTDAPSFSQEFYNATNLDTGHVHNLAHDHAWTGSHSLGLVPSSLSVNYIIKT